MLLDYLYTALHKAHVDGTPILNPLWYKYPADKATFTIDLQFFFGPSLLVSPVTEESKTSVQIYLPNDLFYDFATLQAVKGHAQTITLENIGFTDIPLHIRGGAVLPLRLNGSMTTKALRGIDFELVVAPGLDGKAAGELYVDDGESLKQTGVTEVKMTYENGKLAVRGIWGFETDVNVGRVRIAAVKKNPERVKLSGWDLDRRKWKWDSQTEVLSVAVDVRFNVDFDLVFV